MRRVGQQADAADHEQAGERPRRLLVRARQFHHVAEAVLGVHRLREDDVGPGDRVHDAERVEDLRAAPPAAARVLTACHRRGAERQRGLHQFLGHRADGRDDDGQQVDEDAEEQEGDLLRLVDAEPEDQERDERRDRHVAQRRHDRLEDPVDRLEGAHQHAERQRERRREREGDEDAPGGHPDRRAEVVLQEQLQRAADDLGRRRQEVRGASLP